ncbi:unnamed protein product [Peniophora sp. CBMAI 1063]|nr:unnamed protein product [Peniophora sp. CBMAI 1063]
MHLDTFWHSDGPQPHWMTVEFPRKLSPMQYPLQKMSIYLSYSLTRTHPPPYLATTFDKPDGWITFNVSSELSDDGESFRHIHTYVLQVVVLGNHMNRTDTHVRGMIAHGPPEDNTSWYDPFPWKNDCFGWYEQIR